MYQHFQMCLLVVPNLKLPRAVSQEAPVDPFWDFASDVSVDGIRSVLN